MLVAALLPASLAAQQTTAGTLQGVVSDAVRARPIASATVELTRVQPEPVATFTARSDESGRYRVDSLPAGEYVLHLSTPLLDSLELALPERALTIAPGATVRADFTVPRGAPLRDAVCPGLTFGKGKAVVAGHAIDADTDQPLAGADVTVATEAGAEVRDLSLSARSAATIAALDSIEKARSNTADADELLLTGTATVTGIVRGATGLPLENTEIRVRGARSSAVSDAVGRFTVAALPAGTHMLLARHIGYEPTELPVELRAGRSIEHDVKLARAILLDSVRVVAMRSQYPEFEYNRRANPFGRYLTPDEVERRHATDASGLLFGVPGLYIAGQGSSAKVASTRRDVAAVA